MPFTHKVGTERPCYFKHWLCNYVHQFKICPFYNAELLPNPPFFALAGSNLYMITQSKIEVFPKLNHQRIWSEEHNYNASIFIFPLFIKELILLPVML